MYFYLKQPKSGKETPIIIQYYVKSEGKNFKYSTGEKIHPENWNFNEKIPKSKKGMAGAKLKKITTSIMKYDNLLETLVDNCKLNNTPITRNYLKSQFDSHFKKVTVQENKEIIYFVDFISDFVIKAPSLTNRTTKEKYTRKTVIEYKNSGMILREFEKHEKLKIKLNGFNLQVYDKLINYLKEIKQYAINYIGNLIQMIKKLLKIAHKEFGYFVHEDYTNENFTPIKEESPSIALSEQEIETLLKHDFSNQKHLENCRDFAIIGFWTGLRIGDLLKLPEINLKDDFITVQPRKTKKSSGVKVVIPLHHHVKEVLKKRGMPKAICDSLFNLQIKEVCKQAQLNDLVEGSLNVWIKEIQGYRKRVDKYPKHKLVSSHTCRRSFATNLYKMNFPTLSIMKITGHTTERSFLKYIKITPKEHAEKLLEHWQQYYQLKNKYNEAS